VFEGDRVRITGQDPAEREDPRRHFPGGRRALWWDRLDALYFAGYALWNYFTTPYLLTRIETREEGRRLHAVFPPDVPTHSREQTFHFDERGLLERLDYTAEVFGGWAKAQHVCREHRTFDGLILPTWRRVTPVGRSQPTIVRIEVDAARVTRS
jgi:hypothetical protein